MAGGTIVLVDAQGNETVIEKQRVSLCRCGQSQTKPFCDDAHKTCGFVADEVTIRWREDE
jgi:CDGSH-type Zn-finger protein